MQFAKWTEEGMFFVCRLKDNAKYGVIETLFEREQSEKQAGVMKVEHIHLQNKEDKKQKTLCLRKVIYRDEKGRIYRFITNKLGDFGGGGCADLQVSPDDRISF